jgi:pimeloyl-ACP methyl ester carboxylesterase
MTQSTTTGLGAAIAALALALPLLAAADDGADLLTVDHYVATRSSVPAVAGRTTQLYVRERVAARTLARTARFEDRVVLFIHGAGTPAEVAFDVPVEDYSWMAYLAAAGFDVFSMDVTGYGRSTRPEVMNDPCNFTPEQRAALGVADCEPSYEYQVGNIGADWDDIGAVVDYIRALRGVERLGLVGWSLGGPRAGGYAARNPRKVSRVVLLAPAYDAERPADPPASLPVRGSAMTSQSHADFIANWDRQVGCPDQYDRAAAAAVWSEMLASDSVGATWGSGVRRAPSTTVWGWNKAMAARTTTPMLIVQGAHDKQVAPERAQALYADLGVREKVYIDLACSSHNAMWERNHLLMFEASREWLTQGTVNGLESGILHFGYE